MAKDLTRIPQPGKFVLHELKMLLDIAKKTYPAKVHNGQMSEITANARYSRIADAVDFFAALIGEDARVGDNDEIEDPDAPLPIYTDLDKFHLMVAKNPLLKEIVKKLELEL